MKDSSDKWINMQDLFYDRFLKKEEKILPRINLLAKNDRIGYLYPRRIIPRIDYQNTLFDASKSMIRFKKPRHLIKMIDKILNEKVEVTHSAVLIYDSERHSYVLIDSKGVQGKRMPAGYIRLDLKSPLIELFREKNNRLFESGVVGHKELKWILASGQLLTKETYFHNRLRMALKEMELLDAEICVPCFFKKELLGILVLGKKKSGKNFIHEEMNLFATLANDAAIALANAKLIESLRKKVDEVEHLCEREHQLFINTAIALAKAIDARDIYTHGHTERVTKYCLTIADELQNVIEIKFDTRFRETLHISALLHDIGKIGVPDSILNKKGRFNAEERKVVERHPNIGASILYPIPELNEVAKCVRFHQEWHNGNGYPEGLKKDEIPLIARIVSVADTFDAITSDRPYREKRSADEAAVEIKEWSGRQFDPKVVEAFLKAHQNKKLGSISLDKKDSLC